MSKKHPKAKCKETECEPTELKEGSLKIFGQSRYWAKEILCKHLFYGIAAPDPDSLPRLSTLWANKPSCIDLADSK